MDSSDDGTIDEWMNINSYIIALMSNVESDSDSEFEDDEDMMKRGRSLLGKAPSKNRDFNGVHHRLVADFFSGETSTCNEKYFDRRFRIPRSVLNMLPESVIGQNPLTKNKTRNWRLSIQPLCCFAGALWFLNAGNSCDGTDEHAQMSETVSSTALKICAKQSINPLKRSILITYPRTNKSSVV